MSTGDKLEIVNTRLFDVSADVLFEAVADPKQLQIWWGPESFTNTIHQFDLKPGGDWSLTMHGPDGAEYPNESRFVEISRPSRLVFEHLRPYHYYLMTMAFEPRDGGTQLTWNMVMDADDENVKHRDFITAANEQNFDRLGRHLDSLSS